MTQIDQAIMHAKEPIDGALGTAYATIDGRRYLLFQLKKFEAKYSKNKQEIKRLGTTTAGNRSSGVKGTWTATLYYNTDIFRKMMIDYANTGKDIYFDIQITNDDPNSSAGRHTTIYYDCNIDDVVLSKIDVDNNVLDEDIQGTFERADMPESFKVLDGMEG